jgi:CHAT domain-containing protein
VVGLQGRHAEAEAIARDVLNRWLARIGGGANEVGFAVAAVGRAVFSQGRFADAQQLSRAAIAIQQKAGADSESGFMAGARDVLGSSLAALKNWQEAATVYEERNAALAREPSMAYRGWNVNWALALVKLGRSAEALPMLDRLADLYVRRLGATSYAVAEVRGVRAMARAASGQPREALAEFREALPALLAASDENVGETASRSARDVRIRVILESYLELLRDGAGEAPRTRERLDEAFRIADFLRSQSVQRSVTASAARATVQDPELAAVVRKEQDLANEVTALYAAINRIFSTPPDQQLPKVVADMRARIERIREERFALRQSIEKRFPSFANLINPRPPTLEDAQKVLRRGEVLVATLTMERRTLVWSVPAAGEPVFHDTELGEGELAALVGGLRRAFDVQGGGVPAYDVGRAYELYRRLLQPLEASWQGAQHLLVATEGPLAQLPFALLVTRANDDRAARELEFDQYRSVAWLIRQAAITQIPTVNSIVTLRGLPPGKPGRMAFVGFGDPIFAKAASPQPDVTAVAAGGVPVSLRSASKGLGLASSRLAQLPRLPDTADEILGIAKSLGANTDADVFLRARATEREVMKQDLSNRRVIAFATHGLVPGELDGLTEPALALTVPEVDGVDGDGLLTLEKILGLKLDADWVVLSACNTASGDGAGAEAVSGLGRAFFYAGTRALLVSNWAVETVSARLLTTGIFELQAKDATLTRAEALRRTMLDVMENGVARGADGKAAYRYAHPLFWAPFSLVGDGG